MSKTIIMHTPEVEIEDWEYCFARNPQYNARTGEASMMGGCRFCQLGVRSYKCLLFDTWLKSVAEEGNRVRRQIPKRCEKCLRAEK